MGVGLELDARRPAVVSIVSMLLPCVYTERRVTYSPSFDINRPPRPGDGPYHTERVPHLAQRAIWHLKAPQSTRAVPESSNFQAKKSLARGSRLQFASSFLSKSKGLSWLLAAGIYDNRRKQKPGRMPPLTLTTQRVRPPRTAPGGAGRGVSRGGRGGRGMPLRGWGNGRWRCRQRRGGRV